MKASLDMQSHAFLRAINNATLAIKGIERALAENAGTPGAGLLHTSLQGKNLDGPSHVGAPNTAYPDLGETRCTGLSSDLDMSLVSSDASTIALDSAFSNSLCLARAPLDPTPEEPLYRSHAASGATTPMESQASSARALSFVRGLDLGLLADVDPCEEGPATSAMPSRSSTANGTRAEAPDSGISTLSAWSEEQWLAAGMEVDAVLPSGATATLASHMVQELLLTLEQPAEQARSNVEAGKPENASEGTGLAVGVTESSSMSASTDAHWAIPRPPTRTMPLHALDASVKELVCRSLLLSLRHLRRQTDATQEARQDSESTTTSPMSSARSVG
jgi:hypothetical protein